MADLSSYIKDARTKHVSDEQIKQALTAAGWPVDKVDKALLESDDSKTLPPPPPPVPHVGMWIGFLYILFFISLYVLSIAIAGIFHQWIDTVIPNTKNDLLNYLSDNAYLMRGYIAAVIVSYPVFVMLAIVLRKQLMKQPIIKNLRSRKILIYITLIGTFLIMIGHIIATIYEFLGGNLTANAIGHLCITVMIAGSIFGYFISEVKNDRKTQ